MPTTRSKIRVTRLTFLSTTTDGTAGSMRRRPSACRDFRQSPVVDENDPPWLQPPLWGQKTEAKVWPTSLAVPLLVTGFRTPLPAV